MLADFENECLEVLLLTAKSCRVSVEIEETSERGILVGQVNPLESGAPLLHLKHLSQNAELLPGMKVVTTGRGGVFPAGLKVGRIESVIPGSFESEAFVKSEVDFDSLDIVFIPTSKSPASEKAVKK